MYCFEITTVGQRYLILKEGVQLGQGMADTDEGEGGRQWSVMSYNVECNVQVLGVYSMFIDSLKTMYSTM